MKTANNQDCVNNQVRLSTSTTIPTSSLNHQYDWHPNNDLPDGTQHDTAVDVKEIMGAQVYHDVHKRLMAKQDIIISFVTCYKDIFVIESKPALVISFDNTCIEEYHAKAVRLA